MNSKKQVVEREYTATLKIRMKYYMNAENEIDAERLLDSEINDCEEIKKYLSIIISEGSGNWHCLHMLSEKWGSAYPGINTVRDLHINRDNGEAG